MTKQRVPTHPATPGAGGAAEDPADCVAQQCPLACPDMEIEINNTPAVDDDQVRLHQGEERPSVDCRIRATSRAAGAHAVLSNPDGRIRFPGPAQETLTVSLPDDGSWAPFQISGEAPSQAAGDAIIQARCDGGRHPLKASAAVTVCSLNVASETELTVPADRHRTRLGVTENVTLRASDAVGEVGWAIVAGHGALAAPGGESTTYTAHELEETARIEATDGAGCKTTIEFDVDCNYLITRSRLAQIFTTAPAARIEQMTDAFNEFYAAFGIDTCLRRAHFFAQVLTEVGTGGSPREENMNYTPARLIAVFGYFAANHAEAQLFGRTAAHPANQPAIGNRAYANRIGNGNVASGDGWAFRGRGYLQLTGRGNYQTIQNEITARSPGSGIDIVANPGDAVTIRGGMLSAMAFWSQNNINAHADGGAQDADINAVSQVINPHAHWDRRRNNFHNTTEGVFHVAQCPRGPGP